MTTSCTAAKTDDFPTIEEIIAYANYCMSSRPWDDEWTGLSRNQMDMNMWVTAEGKKVITVYPGDNGCNHQYGITIELREPAVTITAGSGVPTKGHDAKLAEMSLPSSTQSVNRASNFRANVLDLQKRLDAAEQILRDRLPKHDLEYFGDIIAGACESIYGIQLWANLRSYSPGKSLSFRVQEGTDSIPENKTYKVTAEDLQKNWYNIYYHPTLKNMRDWDDLDAEDCDRIIQAHLFNEQIYG